MDEQTPEQPPQEPSQTPPTGELPKEATNMAMLAHLLGITMIGTLIVWLIKKDEHPFIDQEGKEATNFQLTLLIAYVICTVIAVVTCGIGSILYLPVWVVSIIFCIMGAVKAKDGIAYRYPINIRFIK